MPKLVQFNPVVGFGSTGRIAENIGNFVLDSGWESHIVYSGRPAAQSNSNLIRVGNKRDLYQHAIESRLFDNHGRSSKSATNRLVEKLDLIEPDVIHFHNIHGYYLNYEILVEYINKRTIPVIWTFHDFWPITGHCTYFSDVKCEKWKKHCFSCPKTAFYPKSFIDQSKFNFYHKKEVFTSIKDLTITPVSNWASGLIKQSFLGGYNVKTIYNGIDLKSFKPVSTESLRSKYNLGSKKVLLGLATTWGERKGWSDYIALANRLDEDYKIVMIGVSKLQAEHLPNNILGIERTNNLDELVEWYSLAEVVLNLSYQETFGLTTVEGFACGTPSIVYDCTASPELMEKGVGEIVNPGDIDAVVQAVYNIASNGKMHYMTQCISHVRKKFSDKDRYADYLNLYKAKLGSS